MNQFEEALNRYINLTDLEKIQNVKIGIAGAGGLGSNCALMLVRCGFRQLKIVDFDLVDASNLNRQFYFMNQIGRFKSEALKDNLLAINPDAKIESLVEAVTVDNVNQIFTDCNVVVEAFDKVEFKKMVVECYLGSDKLLVAASGIAGWGDSDRIIVHKLDDNFYLVGDLVTEVGPGHPPLAPCVTIAAAKQADIILSWVLRVKNDAK